MAWERMPAMEGSLQRTFTKQGFPPELLGYMQYWANEEEALVAFLGREWAGGRRGDPLRWHLSVRGETDIPEWGQLTDAAHAIRPGVFFVTLVPPRSWWLNVHPNVLHLWETNDNALIQEAKANAMGQTPTRGRKV